MQTKFFKVTSVEYYALDFANKRLLRADISSINGSSTKEVQKEWFEDSDIHSHHATRDCYLVGGSKEIKSIKVVNKIGD